MKNILFALILGATLTLVSSCEGVWGEKTDLSFIEVPKYDRSSEAFIPLLPALGVGGNPTDVLCGFDELVYVVDSASSQIIAFDQAGRRLFDMQVKGVKAIAQDRLMNIYAIGTYTTQIGDVDAIYKIQPLKNGTYRLANDRVIDTIIHPFYFKSTLSENDKLVKLNDIAILPNNDILVTRSGPNNNPLQFGGPDNSVIHFNKNGKFLNNIAVNTDVGVEPNFFKFPFGITSEIQPPVPPSTFVSRSSDFYVTILDPFILIKIQNFRFTATSEGDQEIRLNTSYVIGDTSRASGFMTSPDKFKRPTGITFYRDRAEYIIVSDAAKDSVFLFSKNGYEGIVPLPGSASNKYINVSFGGKGNAPNQFNNPCAVAYANRILYVCDKGNKRISRFRLTRDME